jgi:hypothetical protein
MWTPFLEKSKNGKFGIIKKFESEQEVRDFVKKTFGDIKEV